MPGNGQPNNSYYQNNTSNYQDNTANVYQPTVQYDSQQSNQNSGTLAIVSLVCGILSILCCCCCGFGFILGVAAIVCGVLGMKGEKSGLAIGGLVCGIIGIFLSPIGIGVFIGMMEG